MNRGTGFLGIVGLVVLVTGLIAYGLLEVDLYYFAPLHLAVGALLLCLFLLRGGVGLIGSAAVSHASAAGLHTILYTVLFFGVLIVVNLLTARHQPFRYDATEQKVYTLAPQTVDVFRSLQQPLVARAFPLGGRLDGDLTFLFKQLSAISPRFSWRVIDPERSRELVERYGISELGTVHLSYGVESDAPSEGFQKKAAGAVLGERDRERATKLTGKIGEEQLLEGVLKLTRGRERKIYYLTGNGERELESKQPDGYSAVAEAIEGENIALHPLLLGEHPEVPRDADAILVIAPERKFPALHFTAIQQYLEQRHGRALFLSEPPVAAGARAAEAAVADDIARLVAPLGIELGRDIVFDQLEGVGWGTQPVSMTYGAHAITEGFSQLTVYATARSVRAEEVVSEHEELRTGERDSVGKDRKAENGAERGEVTELVFTGKNSWAESDVVRLTGESGEAEFGEGDIKGPVPIAAAFEESIPGETTDAGRSNVEPGRVVVVGDADWVANVNINQSFNRDLLLNMVNWIVGEEDGITLRPKTIRQSLKVLTSEQFLGIFLVGGILVPELIVLCGFGVWWFRKRS